MKNSRFFQKSKDNADLVETAYEGIRQMLFFNEFAAGQKIAYREIAKQLKMSPTPVVQALKWLEFQGLVKHKTNKGYYTEQVSLSEIEEIYNTRQLIEVSLLPKVLANINKKSISKLQKVLEISRKAKKDGHLNQRLFSDVEFHLTLASISQCRTQLQILKNLFNLLYLKYRSTLLFVDFDGSVLADYKGSVVADHEDMIRYVEENNLEKLKETMESHIIAIKNKVIKKLSQYMEEREQSAFYHQ